VKTQAALNSVVGQISQVTSAVPVAATGRTCLLLDAHSHSRTCPGVQAEGLAATLQQGQGGVGAGGGGAPSLARVESGGFHPSASARDPRLQRGGIPASTAAAQPAAADLFAQLAAVRSQLGAQGGGGEGGADTSTGQPGAEADAQPVEGAGAQQTGAASDPIDVSGDALPFSPAAESSGRCEGGRLPGSALPHHPRAHQAPILMVHPRVCVRVCGERSVVCR
jgi:hypothetical protein